MSISDEDVVWYDTRETVEPTPGSFVPLRDVNDLNNHIVHFRDGELVAYQVGDPILESPEHEEDGNDSPIYMYAVVKTEALQQNVSKDIPIVGKQYRVDLGPDWEEVDVPGTRLYRLRELKDIVRDNSRCMSITDVGAQLRDIRLLLEDARRCCPVQEQKRVIFRLLLAWHPDINPWDREALCTSVSAEVRGYHPDDHELWGLPPDRDDVDARLSLESDLGGSSSPPSFFSRTEARARAIHSSGCVHQGAFDVPKRTPRAANPQPGEGQRWMRTAESDLASARAALDTSNNWACFMAHQAVEKSLKAVLYYRDADNDYLQSHRLPHLASQVGDPHLKQLAFRLEKQVGPHTRMRYPDVIRYPGIPADVYSRQHAANGCGWATEALAAAKRLCQVQAARAPSKLQ